MYTSNVSSLVLRYILIKSIKKTFSAIRPITFALIKLFWTRLYFGWALWIASAL